MKLKESTSYKLTIRRLFLFMIYNPYKLHYDNLYNVATENLHITDKKTQAVGLRTTWFSREGCDTGKKTISKSRFVKAINL